MIHKIWDKLVLFGASLATITVLTAAPSVQAATLFYDLKFLDNFGEEVGFGAFSYDDTAPFEGKFEHPFTSLESVNIDASEGWYLLQSFDATINGVNWNIGNSTGGKEALFWRPFESEKPASVERDRFGIPLKSPGRWLFGNTRYLPALLVESDSWVQFAFNSPTGLIFGTWEVTQRPTTTPVPEPSLIFSLMILGTSSLFMTSKNCKS